MHFDDSVDVVTEWRDLTARHNEQLGIFGIKVPRHWKTQRAVAGVDWYQNIVDADPGRLYQVSSQREPVILLIHCILHWIFTC